MGKLFAALFAFLFPALALSAYEYRPRELIIKYKDGVRRNRATQEAIYRSGHVVHVKRLPARGVGHNIEQLLIEEGVSLEKAMHQIRENSAVDYVHPNYVVRTIPELQKVGNITRSRAVPRRNWSGWPCVPGWEMPGCQVHECLFPGFPPGCGETPTGQPVASPAPKFIPPPVNKRPADVVPPVEDINNYKTYGMTKIGADQAWAQGIRGSQDVVVAVIDTGVDYNHEDLNYNIWRNQNVDPAKKDYIGWDFVHDDSMPYDDNDHGTHCSGTIGGVGGNGKGVSGVNQRVSIMGVKFLDEDGSGDLADSIRAIDFAVQHGAKVLSNSWGAQGTDEGNAITDAIKRAEKAGVLVIAAAGNSAANVDNVSFIPAGISAPNMISVAATDSNDEMASFSNYGSKTVHMGAPGVDVYSTLPGGNYAAFSGTSMACPHVAGAAALVWSQNPTATYADIKRMLFESAEQVVSLQGKTITGGRLHLGKALHLK